MDVFRIDLGEHTCNHVQRVKVLGHVRSNILEDEIAGCVISPWDTGTMKLYMLNWKTGKFVVIETGLPVSGLIIIYIALCSSPDLVNYQSFRIDYQKAYAVVVRRNEASARLDLQFRIPERLS